MQFGDHFTGRNVPSPEPPLLPLGPPPLQEQQKLLLRQSASGGVSGSGLVDTGGRRRSESGSESAESGAGGSAGGSGRHLQEDGTSTTASRSGGRVRYCARCRTHGERVRLESGTHHPLVCPFRCCTCRQCARLDRRSQRQQTARATERMRRFTELQQMIRSGGGPEPDVSQAEQLQLSTGSSGSAALKDGGVGDRSQSPVSVRSMGSQSPGPSSKPTPSHNNRNQSSQFPFKITTALTRKYTPADNVSRWGFPRISRRAQQLSSASEASACELDRGSRISRESEVTSGGGNEPERSAALPSPPPLQPIGSLAAKPDLRIPHSPTSKRGPEPEAEPEPESERGEAERPNPDSVNPSQLSQLQQLQQLQMLGLLGTYPVLTRSDLPGVTAGLQPQVVLPAVDATGAALLPLLQQLIPLVLAQASAPLLISPQAAALGLGLQPLVAASIRDALEMQAHSHESQLAPQPQLPTTPRSNGSRELMSHAQTLNAPEKTTLVGARPPLEQHRRTFLQADGNSSKDGSSAQSSRTPPNGSHTTKPLEKSTASGASLERHQTYSGRLEIAGAPPSSLLPATNKSRGRAYNGADSGEVGGVDRRTKRSRMDEPSNYV